MTEDHNQIWLEPKAEDYGPEGRLWCQDGVWDDGVRYLRAEIVEGEIERLKLDLDVAKADLAVYAAALKVVQSYFSAQTGFLSGRELQVLNVVNQSLLSTREGVN